MAVVTKRRAKITTARMPSHFIGLKRT